MSRRLIDRSPDLLRLRDAGYNIKHKKGHILMWDVPYLNAQREVMRGTLISTAEQRDDVAIEPTEHWVYFVGEKPHRADGAPLPSIINETGGEVAGGRWNIQLSSKLSGGKNYANYYDKFQRYVNLLTGPARTVDPTATAQTRRPTEADEDESVFVLEDTWSAKSRIGAIVDRLKPFRLAIVGLGGTGAHVLDLLAKTPVASIDLFDGDTLGQHNIWRYPGAVSRAVVAGAPRKVDYLANTYAALRREIRPHPYFVTESNVAELATFDFVFVCVDKGPVRALVASFLRSNGIVFVDVGMGLRVNDLEQIYGMTRTTLVTSDTADGGRLPVRDAGDDQDDAYAQNVQTVELNAVNAAAAVIRWKKHVGFYADMKPQTNSLYVVGTNRIVGRA